MTTEPNEVAVLALRDGVLNIASYRSIHAMIDGEIANRRDDLKSHLDYLKDLRLRLIPIIKELEIEYGESIYEGE